MITEKQLKIFETFAKQPFTKLTRKEIKKDSKEKSNNALALAINALKKENVLREEKIGKSGILSLNLDSDATFYYLALCNLKKISKMAWGALEPLKKEIIEETPFFSIVIFGSYSIGEQTKDSDIDVAIFIEDKKSQKKIEALANSARLKSVFNMDIHIITKEEMIEMLANKEENLGKQIARKHLAVYNHRIFYELIKKGMRHGFRI